MKIWAGSCVHAGRQIVFLMGGTTSRSSFYTNRIHAFGQGQTILEQLSRLQACSTLKAVAGFPFARHPNSLGQPVFCFCLCFFHLPATIRSVFIGCFSECIGCFLDWCCTFQKSLINEYLILVRNTSAWLSVRHTSEQKTKHRHREQTAPRHWRKHSLLPQAVRSHGFLNKHLSWADKVCKCGAKWDRSRATGGEWFGFGGV